MLAPFSRTLSGGCATVGVAESPSVPAHLEPAPLPGLLSHGSQREGPPSEPAPSTGQAGKSREATRAWLPSLAFLPEESVSSGFQLDCSQVEKQLKPEVSASLHLCAT